MLQGLDLERHRPTFALVEVLDEAAYAAVEGALGSRYEAVERLTPTDVLFRLRAI